MPCFDSAELRECRFSYPQIDACSRSGFVYGHHALQRRSAIHERYGPMTQGRFGTHYCLYHEIGDVNGSKGHIKTNSIYAAAKSSPQCVRSFRFSCYAAEINPRDVLVSQIVAEPDLSALTKSCRSGAPMAGCKRERSNSARIREPSSKQA